ncbi:hypothetical protein [Corynebacterium vitaeruminis]|jgi:hypothetical protein|uniref:Uncharacterized protein n=1 Tax=Corynebacterium vitaeruminis DSM 20294 TaxID=1224164 RepID=W5XXT5_9CORY|nr:hypothetical protein [Corynebacterium vitaeruminis]AHI21480.1 hypothetical protein B843_00420 [Corynebacterium vitaeruminis DSM 20294]
MDAQNKEYAKRFWDELAIRKPSDPPTNLSELLEDLGIEDSSRSVQRATVEEWLKDNEPIGALVVDLELDFGIII